MFLPKARTTEIIEQEAGKELLIYDLRSDKAYTLNETSAIVYLACGNQSFQDLKSKHNFTDDLIYLALDELAANNLIEDYRSDHFAGLSRRDVIRKVGLATMAALPVIAAVAAPAAATAASLTVCQRANCNDGSQFCNNAPGCAALRADFVCCSALGTCSCAPANVCLGNGGTICPR
jgi:hypothetical protein